MSNTIKERITAVEVKLDDALNNHLPHLDAKIDKVDSKVDKVQDKLDRGQWFVLTTLVGVVLTLALTLWK